jgi:hypothetical protein
MHTHTHTHTHTAAATALHKNNKRVSFIRDSAPKLNIETVLLKELAG